MKSIYPTRKPVEKKLDKQKIYELAKLGFNQKEIGAQLGYKQARFSVKMNQSAQAQEAYKQGREEFEAK